MRKEASFALGLCLMLCLSGCGSAERQKDQEPTKPAEAAQSSQVTQAPQAAQDLQTSGASFTVDTKIEDVINDPAFEEYGRRIRLCGSYAGQFPSCLRAVQTVLQCLRTDLPSRGTDRLGGFGPGHRLYF